MVWRGATSQKIWKNLRGAFLSHANRDNVRYFNSSPRVVRRGRTFDSNGTLSQPEANVANLHAIVVAGTRPEVIKLAPVVGQCRRRADEIVATVCFTGQHRELVRDVAEYFGVVPDVDLQLMTAGQSLCELTSRMLTALDAVFAQTCPDCVVVQGDTTTVLAASLAAFYRRLPVVHVEAGLRTGNLDAPWPEEMNRRVATLAASLHCAATERAVENLLAEGVPSAQIYLTGNTVIDALLATIGKESANGHRWKCHSGQVPFGSAIRVRTIKCHSCHSGQNYL